MRVNTFHLCVKHLIVIHGYSHDFVRTKKPAQTQYYTEMVEPYNFI